MNKIPESRSENGDKPKFESAFQAKKSLPLWITGIFVTVVTIFGLDNYIGLTVRGCVDKELESVKEAIQDAMKAGILAEDRAKTAGVAIAEMDKQSRAYAKTVLEFQEKVAAAQLEVERLSQNVTTIMDEYVNLSGETGHVKDLIAKDINNLRVGLKGLEEFVRRLAQETTAASSEALLIAYEAEVRKAERTAEIEREKFEQNAKYRIRVFFNETTKVLSDKVLNKLSKVGFKVSNLDITRAEELLSPIQGRAPYPLRDARQTLTSIRNNIITYTQDVDINKVDQVRDSIASFDEVGNFTVLTWEFFARKYGDPFLAHVSPNEFFRTNLIEIYLVSLE